MTYDEILNDNHGIFHKARLTMDGKILDDYPENVEFNNMANDSSGIELGTTYASALTLEIRNVSVEILNQEVFVEDGARDPDGNFAWKPLGYFMAVSGSHDRGITKYTMYDRMAYKLAGQYVTSLTFPTTDKAVIEEICTRCGVKLIGTLTAHTIDTAPSGTNKDVLGYMLQLQGKNAVFNENGDLELKWYEDKGYTIDDTQIYMEGDASTTATFTIGYIKNTRSVKKTETKYEEQTEYDDEGNASVKNVPYTEESTEEQTYVAGDGLQGIVFANPYMTQAIVNELYEKLKKFSYTPATFHLVGDYRVRAMDIVTVTTDGGKKYKVPVMAIDHSSDGGLTSTVYSYGVSESSGSMDSGSSNSRALERYDADLAYLKAVYANTMNAERAKILFLQTKELQAEVGKFGYVKSKELEAEVGKFGYVKTGELTAEVAKLGYVTAATVEAQYARLDKANIPTAWIDTAMIGEGVVGTVQIADGSITDAKIVGLTASKLTAGRIDAGVIEVVNLNAANITVGTINGVQIAPGAIDKSKLDSLLTDWISSTDTDVDKALKEAGLASSEAATATSTANAASSTASTAKSAADNAQNTANEASTKAETAQTAATNAQSTANSAVSIANGKTTAYYQTSQPSGGTYKTNDLWFDTDGGYQMYYYNGSKWVATQYGSAAILASAVTSGKIAAGAVVADAIAANAVTAGKIATNAVTASTIAANAVTTDKVAANAITSVKIAADAVTAEKIVAEAVTSAKIATGAVIAEKIATNAVTADKIAAKAVTADKMSVTDLSAISAKIGGWELGTGYIRDKDTSNRYAGIGRNGVTYAFFAGGTADNGSDGKFRVGHDGTMVATNATITGAIKATSFAYSEEFGNGSVFFAVEDGYLNFGYKDSNGTFTTGLAVTASETDISGSRITLESSIDNGVGIIMEDQIWIQGYTLIDNCRIESLATDSLTVGGVNVGSTLNSLNSKLSDCKDIMFCVHKNVDTSNSNYIFSNGIYGVSPNTGNLPEKNWGGLLVFNTNGDSTCHASNAWIYQIYISHATQKMYLRMNINYTAAGWTAWKEH